MDKYDNTAKSRHGKNAISSIRDLLDFCKEQKYIEKYEEPFRIGKEGYSNKQFYAPYLIVFSDGEKWILFSTTSMKTDRIKGNQWDALNIKAIDKKVTKCYLVYPDGVSDKDKSEFIRQNEKYISKTEYSAIDGVINQEALYTLIETQAIKEMSVGKQKDLQGRVYECRLAGILKFKQNLKKWKTDDITAVGLHYSVFIQVVTKLGLNPANTKEIYATADKKDIGLLPSRGNPKTDILIKVTDVNDNVTTYTLSCKKSSEAIVSVHQFSADACIAILENPSEELKGLIKAFQANPTLKDFGETNGIAMTNALKTHLKRLALWALGGIGGIGNPDTQWAQYILTYDNNTKTTHIHTIEEYYQKLLDSNVSGHFGTVFQWTYPSKQRGKNIQFKVKTL